MESPRGWKQTIVNRTGTGTGKSEASSRLKGVRVMRTWRRTGVPKRTMRLLLPFCLMSVVVAAVIGQSEHPQERIEHAIGLALRGDYEGARATLEGAFHSFPKDPRILTNLGNVSLLSGQPRLAIAFYEFALRRDPEDPGIRLNVVIALHAMKEEEEARRHAAIALGDLGGLDEAYELLGLRLSEDKAEEPNTDEAGVMSREELEAFFESVARIQVPVEPAPGDTSTVPPTLVEVREGELESEELEMRNTIRLAPKGNETPSAVTSGRLLYWKMLKPNVKPPKQTPRNLLQPDRVRP